MHERRTTCYLAYELPIGFETEADEKRAKDRKTEQGIDAGNLPARRRPLAPWEKTRYLMQAEPILERYLAASWNCCDQNWVDGLAYWRIPNSGSAPWVGSRWWVEPGEHGDDVETKGPKPEADFHRD